MTAADTIGGEQFVSCLLLSLFHMGHDGSQKSFHKSNEERSCDQQEISEVSVKFTDLQS